MQDGERVFVETGRECAERRNALQPEIEFYTRQGRRCACLELSLRVQCVCLVALRKEHPVIDHSNMVMRRSC